MANFIPTKHEANEYNGGVQYINSDPAQGIGGDALQAETVNNLVESALWTQEEVVSARETAEDAYSVASEANDKVDGFLASQDAPPPVGYHYIQFNGEPTPASRWAGTTWTIDTDYQGRTIIGSGGSYSLGAMGGSETHTLTIEEMPSHGHDIEGGTGSINEAGVVIQRGYGGEINLTNGTIAKGGSLPHNNMPPYTVVNYWKRTA